MTAKDNIGSGLAILIAMIVRVIPMKLGYAQILSKSGLRKGFQTGFEITTEIVHDILAESTIFGAFFEVK